MFLKSIEMTGFKSFPEKTQMTLYGSIIGVIGPNGSGKSNVADAVRWVLGEQSAKSLRGGLMQDIIFAGTQTRNPRSFCEVSLLFDNSDKRIDIEYTEIEIARKLYRSGESEYYINRTKCRLKDILDIFRDTGIGKEGYSIIGQGRIDEILSDKSTDRRRIFEEASGIMKYRVRKEEAERKLERTRHNMVRIDDILREQSFMLEPLKQQAEDAKVYLELSAKLKTLDINLFLRSYDRAREKIERLEQQKIAYEEERLQTKREKEELISKLARQQESARQTDDTADAIAQRISVLMTETERIEGEIRLCDERISNNNKDTLRLKQEVSTAHEKQAIYEQDEAKNLARLGVIEKEIAVQNKTERSLNLELDALLTLTHDRMQSIETMQSMKVEAVKNQANASAAINAIEQRIDTHQQRKVQIVGKLKELDEEKEKIQNAILEFEKQTEDNRLSYQEIKLRIEKTAIQEKELNQNINGIRERIEAAKRDYSSAVSSHKVLADIKSSFEGYGHSVKKLMIASKENASLGALILGTVADMISVPARFETAMEACLGAALQNVIVNDEYAAKKLIEYLRRNSIGRVTFLPLDSLRARFLSDFERKAIAESGAVGIASELIDTDARKAVDFLLGRTVVVEDMNAAINLMRKCSQSFRTVTLEGDVINPGGSITGGSIRRENAGLVSRDRREQQLKTRITEIKEIISGLETKCESLVEQQIEMVSGLEKKREALHRCEIKAAELREKCDSLAAAATNNERQEKVLCDEEKQIDYDVERFEKESEQHALIQTDISRQNETSETDFKRLEDEYKRNEGMAQQIRDRIHSVKLKTAGLLREIESLQNDNARIAAEKHEIKRVCASRGKTLELNEQSDENLHKLKSTLEQTRKQKSLELSDIKMQQAKTVQSRDVLFNASSKLEQRIEKIRTAYAEAGEKCLRTSFLVERTQADIENAQNKLWDTYQLTYTNALKLKEDISLAGAASEAERIREKLHGLGSVNTRAVEEYAALKERMTTLARQRDDLDEAEQDLNQLMSSLMIKMRTAFRNGFEQINKRFGETFEELFDGGYAELVLEENEDIMECNIEIIAEPPGKKLQKISLLSGGEKALTAICLLFALLKINPSPVCVLDEIDAALDEINVRKFADYLKKNAKKMQFIVITHRKPTMAVCDSLFGFAMEEKGVSKLLSVRLDKEVI